MKEAILRLIEVQKELKAPKGNYNKFGNYKYRSAEDILKAVKPLLAEHNLLMTISDSVDCIGDRVYIVATATVIDAETGETVTTNTAYAREGENKKGMTTEQITGSCSSYARKYCLNGIFLIDDTKDADTDEYHKQTTERVPDLSSLKGLFDTTLTNKEKEDTLKFYEVKELKDLSDEQKIELANLLAKKARKKAASKKETA